MANPIASPFSESDINLLSSVVFPGALGNQTELLKALATQVTKARSLRSAIDAVVSDLHVPVDDETKLGFVISLYTLSDCSIPVVAFCFSQDELAQGVSSGSILSQRDLAGRILATPVASQGVPAGSERSWTKLRERLFAKEATSVLSWLIHMDMIPVPEGYKDIMTLVLATSIHKSNFDIGKQSIRTLLAADDIFVDGGVEKPQQQVVRSYLFRLQRLQALVNEPQDIGALMKCGYISAEGIAKVGERAVYSIMNQGIPRDRAETIRNHAVFVASRSEHLWTRALMVRGTSSNMDVSLAAVNNQFSEGDTGDKKEINLTTMFGIDSIGCEECASITGPAAFFVDLLHTLAGTPVKKPDSDTLDPQITLLDKLFERRADLGNLELSCANTKVLVPYIDLVNEVLESVVWHLKVDEEALIPPFDADEKDTSNDCLVQPQNTNFKVYSEIVQPIVSPMPVFPYNQAVHSIRAFLTALGVSRYRLLSVFRSPFSITSDSDLLPRVDAVFDHALAAEVLNLQHEDYVAITRRGFYPLELINLLPGGEAIDKAGYGKIITLKTVSEYWGYEKDEDMISEKGLTMVKGQLLPRSGVVFRDLLSVLKTKYFDGTLVIEIEQTGQRDGELKPTEILERMRLREWKLDQQLVPLTPKTCERFQAFLRLRSKLQWPIDELDAVVHTLAGTNLPPIIDAQLLDSLAAVKQLAELANLSPTELQPLWGDINTYGQNSLYERLFLSATLPDGERELFTPDSDGRVLQNKSIKINDHLYIVLMALNMTAVEFESIKNLLDQGPETSSVNLLTLANISTFYRISILCKILKISPQAYSSLLKLFPEYPDPFKDPRTSLALVQSYPPIQPMFKHWTLERLLFVIKDIPSTTEEKCNPTLEKNLEIMDSIRSGLADPALEDFKRKMEDQSAFAALIAQLVTNADDRKKILRFIEDEDIHSIESEEAIIFIRQLSPILGSTAATELCKKINEKRTTKDRQDAFLNAFVPAIYRAEQCQTVLKLLRSFFPDLSMALLVFSLEKLIQIKKCDIKQDCEDSDTMSGMDVLLQLAEMPTPKGENFTGYFRPPTTDVYSILSATPNEPKAFVLDEIPVKFQKSGTGDDLLWIAYTNSLVGSQWYKLQYEGEVSDLTWAPQQTMGSKPLAFSSTQLVEGQAIKNTARVIVELMRVSILTGSFRLDAIEVEFGMVLQNLMTQRGLKRFDFGQLRLQDIRDFERYFQLREEFSRNGATLPLLKFYKWLFSFNHDDNGENALDGLFGNLIDKLAKATGWSKDICVDFLQVKYPNYTGVALVKLFQDVSTLHQMREAIVFVRGLGLPSLSLGSLFAIAQPVWQELVKVDFTNAASLRLALQSRRLPKTPGGGKDALSEASDQIRSSQRAALIQCLLSSKSAGDKDLTDADQLFGYFLIDVQMGPGLQTSRIKQAISSVQLFAQRCALGAEKGVDQNVLGRSNLEYLLRYRLWEADRKAYLYPENWIDPTLRDNKSEQFQSIESKMMQAKLDSTSVTGIIKDYIDSVDEIANLRVESYLIEEVEDAFGRADYDNIHIFGRTRTSPPTFYYRKAKVPMKIYWAPNWTAWSKIDVEIPVQETDAEGKMLPRPGSYLLPAIYKGRLYVFLPDIILGQKSKSLEGTTYDNLRSQNITTTQADHFWEIRMGFIELRNGKWSPKILSRSVISVKTEGTGVSEFKFWIRHGQDKGGDPTGSNIKEANCSGEYVTDTDVSLTIAVEWLVGGRPVDAGKFELRDQQLILLDSDGMPTSEWSPELRPQYVTTISTEFSRLRRSLKGPNEIKDLKIPHNKKDIELLLGGKTLTDLPPADKYVYDWNVDLNYPREDKASGLLFEVSTNKRIMPYIDLFEIYYFRVDKFFNRISPQLVETARKDGLEPIFNYLRSITQTAEHEDAFGRWTEWTDEDDTDPPPPRVHYHECASPFAIYNWELGVHIPSLIMERLMATQQFDLALKAVRLAFDPSRDGTGVGRCWSFPPFQEDIVRTGEFDTNLKTKMTVDEWRESNGNVHAAARGHPVAYMKRIAMKYIELLVAMGDDYFRQDTLESIPFAIQMYTEASHVFGPQPVEVPQLGKRAVKTYNQIEKDSEGKDALDALSNATVDMELDFLFYIAPGSRGNNLIQGPRPRSFLKTGYFCVPGNPYPVSLRATIDDRLYKIRNGMDINGNRRTLPLFEPPIDPGALVRAKGLDGKGIAGSLSDLESPMPRYRFSYLIQRALELVNELKASGQQLLSIKEKKDAEALSMLRYKHQNTVLALAMRIKEYQKVEVRRSIETLEETRRQQEMRLNYYLALTGDTKEIPRPGANWQDIPQSIEKPKMDEFRMSPFEQEELNKAEEATQLNINASIIEAAAAAAFAIPNFGIKAQPLGVGIDTAFGGQNIGQILLCAASAIKVGAQRALDDGAKAARKAGATRQLQERRLEANTIGRELVRIDKDLDMLHSRLDTSEAEIKAQKQEIDNAIAEEEWLRTKYTGRQLYTLLDNSMGTLFHQAYLMAIEMTKTAKRAFDFELALRPQSSSGTDSIAGSGGYWENSRDGQLSGEALFLALKRMESMYIETRTHDFEILKTVSLRQINPEALLQFQEDGWATFDVPEVLFDMDFPGHYCRRIFSVAVSIPCIIGPYTTISCTLNLQQHKYRISSTPGAYSSQEEASFRTDHIPITSIAVSSGIQDTSTLDLNFRGNELYGPFEGAGAISTWRIGLPKKHRQFDYTSITDVVLHLRYTAFSAGGSLEDAASNAVDEWVTKSKSANEDGYGKGVKVVAIDLKNDYPSEWYQIASTGSMTLQNLDRRFPFWARGQNISPKSITLFINPKPGEPRSIQISNGKTAGLEEGGNLGGYSRFTATGSLPGVGANKPWTIMNLGKDKTFERGWLVVQYSI